MLWQWTLGDESEATKFRRSRRWKPSIRSKTIFDNWKPFKNDESVFYFTLKTLLVLKIFKFLSWTFWSWLEGSCLFWNLWRHNLVNKQLQYTYCPISQDVKSNQTLKFDQSIEYNMRNIFVEKSYANCAGEIIPRPLSKKPKLTISLDH